MKLNKILTIIMCMALVVFAGCSSGDDDTRSSGVGSGTSSSNSPSPTQGVTLEFVEGNPPNEIFKGTPVNFAFVFRNNQKHEISNLEMRTSGFDRGFVSGLREEYTISSIPAASEAAGQGIYSGLVEQGVVIDNFQGSYDFNPEFTYCYEATSTHSQAVCVPSSTNQCDTEFQQSKSNNGPLTVSINNINTVGDNVLIRFSVENKGPGVVVNECFNTQDYATSYDVSAKLGTAQGDCFPSGSEEFLLTGGESGNFQCEFPRSSEQGSYSTQLVVELGHLYQQSLKEQIEVVDLNQ